MRNLLFSICFILVSVIKTFSQDIAEKPPHNWNKFLHVEAGYIYPDGTIRESIAIKQNVSSYYVNQYSSGYVSAATSGFTLGLRWEYFYTKFKIGFSTGLRYYSYNSEISGYTSSNADFFYLRYSIKNSDTKFARVKSITEDNKYISIPLEITYIPFQYKSLSLFVKGGVDFSIFNLKNDTDIHFHDDAMEIHQDLILSSMSETGNKFHSTLYGTVGLNLGQKGKVNYSVEAFLPSYFLSKNNFSLTEVDTFEGFKLAVKFPIRNRN